MIASTEHVGARSETVSLVLQAVVGRISSALVRPGADQPMLMPTVFLAVRQDETLTSENVVARKV